jgi:hypothetical protein
VVANPPAVNIEETRRQAMRQNDREVRDTIVRVLAQRLARTADTSWSGNDFDLTGVLFEDAWFAGARFNGRHVWFDGAAFNGKDTSFDDARFAGEYVSFRRVGFSSQTTSFGRAAFKCLRASFESPAQEERRVRMGEPAKRNPAGDPALHHAATVAAVPCPARPGRR